MSDKIELMRLCWVLQSNFSCLSQSESRTQPCHVRIRYNVLVITNAWFYEHTCYSVKGIISNKNLC